MVIDEGSQREQERKSVLTLKMVLRIVSSALPCSVDKICDERK